jgi:hypothetical protein
MRNGPASAVNPPTQVRVAVAAVFRSPWVREAAMTERRSRQVNVRPDLRGSELEFGDTECLSIRAGERLRINVTRVDDGGEDPDGWVWVEGWAGDRPGGIGPQWVRVLVRDSALPAAPPGRSDR